jgi:paraquat-inducible protein A
MASAASRGLASCHVCGLLCRLHAPHAHSACPRCRARLHLRKPGSILRTWALLVLATVLYVPANTLPILESHSLIENQSSTIMAGIILFWNSGSWFVASLIFIASIVVPLTKLIALALLLISVQRRSAWAQQQRTQLYRLVEFIGRWSMLDIFVVALTVALVQVGALASIQAGPGAVAFGAVVIITMLAAHSFDPRLIWDATESQTREQNREKHG